MSDGDLELTPEHMTYINVPQIHWKTSLAAIPRTCKHLSVITDLMQRLIPSIEKGEGWLLFGDYSTGKSAIAAMLLKQAARYRCFGFWINALDIPGYAIEKTLFEGELAYERAVSTSILVIDELVLRENGGPLEQYMEMLVRRRLAAQRSTVITSNHAPSVIQARYPALYAALLEAVTPIKIQGHNFREALARRS